MKTTRTVYYNSTGINGLKIFITAPYNFPSECVSDFYLDLIYYLAVLSLKVMLNAHASSPSSLEAYKPPSQAGQSGLPGLVL